MGDTLPPNTPETTGEEQHRQLIEMRQERDRLRCELERLRHDLDGAAASLDEDAAERRFRWLVILAFVLAIPLCQILAAIASLRG